MKGDYLKSTELQKYLHQEQKHRKEPFNLEKEHKNRQILLAKNKYEILDNSTYQDNYFYRTIDATQHKFKSASITNTPRNIQKYALTTSPKTVSSSQILQSLNLNPEEITKVKTHMHRDSSHQERFGQLKEEAFADRLLLKNPQYPKYQLPFRGTSQYQQKYNEEQLRASSRSRQIGELKRLEDLILGKAQNPTFHSDHFHTINQKGWMTERINKNLPTIQPKVEKFDERKKYVQIQIEQSQPFIQQLPGRMPSKLINSTQRLDFNQKNNYDCKKKSDLHLMLGTI
ncbi:UNKNOWN [Stylonychia lemnae]|uniref:Uncharacterized protein n=1 Tax=Stylonychia lemnae TaxID=5949 RepID=A0A078AL83_STYLE|nr:UNKNOWN [Stylonychia lemnae]|eukprot:CDW81623.1 UNKNOWN [Stylonychia lemnae]